MKTLDVRKANKTQWVLQGIGAFFVFMLPHLVGGVALEIGTYSPAYAADLTGVSRIVDGDTFVIGSEKVRLQGIDAPETDQVCLNANGVRWTCGERVQDRPSRNYSRAHAAVAEGSKTTPDGDNAK